jgi:cytochrome c biogenesis protein CcmG/thiol:disulfide interchange protein DsbE
MHSSRWRVLLVPLLLFGAVLVFLAIGLTLDPREVPSPLIGKAVPDFSLPPVKAASRDSRAAT